jgi:glutathione S-transferase
MQLFIGNKLYSSWSLRPWILMKAMGVPFTEEVIPLRHGDTSDRILKHSPSGKVPCLVDGDVRIWESLAICEYLNDKFPDRGVWPKDIKARAHARAAASEMHAGFQALRNACPMNLGKTFKTPAITPDLQANVARIEALWSEARGKFGKGGPFLYGAFSAADAMFAPVVTRFATYQIPVSAATRTYMDAVQTHPAFVAWREAALAEPWSLPDYETGHTVVAVHHKPAVQTPR